MTDSTIDEITTFRRRLHAMPELSEQERQTAGTIVERLRETGADRIVEKLGSMETGVCAIYDSGADGPAVLLRAELDALPIQETNSFDHCSKNAGVSHKCGHDGHMATLVAVAKGLRARPVERGRVYLLFQPAEETGTGAAAVIADKRFEALPRPDYVYAFHNVPKYPLGCVLLRDGLFAQASTGFIVTFSGSTSHSSYPEHGLNPSHAVTELVDAVNGFGESMAGDVTEPVLGTISYAELGTAEKGANFGTTPGKATVMGVVRAHRSDDLEKVRTSLEQLTIKLAGESRLSHTLTWHEAFAATTSDPDSVSIVELAARRTGLDVHRLEQPFRWSEDFGYFTDAYTGAFFGLGSGTAQPQLHDDGYDYPDELIDIGARLYREIIDTHLG